MIKLSNTYKIYENGTVAVRNASLEFPRFGMVAIVGQSGCGKSTLLNLLSNNDTPSKGEVLYNGTPYSKCDQNELIKDFAYIYQDFKLIENITVYQNIIIGHELASKDVDNDFVLQIADKLGLTEYLDQKVFALSGGQQQRVAIARALVRRPKVVFADEPTGNLDSINSENVYKILKEISKEILVIIVSHDDAINNYADKTIEMSNGRVVDEYENTLTIQKEEENQYKCTEKTANNIDTDLSSTNTKSGTLADKRNKKSSKIGTKSIFSYQKGRNIVRKKQGLSFNSTIGLTLSFNNKGIVKKAVLSFICAVMIGFILASTSMMFSSYEKTFYNMLKKSEDKLVSFYIATNMADSPSDEEFEQFMENNFKNNFVLTYGKNGPYYEDDYKLQSEKSLPPCYDHYYGFSGGVGVVELYIDNPEEIGLKMLYGRVPVERDEIAISKTNLDYWLYCKDFVSKSTGETHHFGSVEDIIGKKNFAGSIFTVVGVFDDRNASNNVNWTEEEVYDYTLNNFLHNSVLRPKKLSQEFKFFENGASNYKFSNNTNSILYKDYISIMPLNTATKEYFNNEALNKYTINKGEVVITNDTLIEKMERQGTPLKVGDYIDFSYVKIHHYSPWETIIDERYFKKSYKIVGIEKRFVGEIFLNEEEYESIYKPVERGRSILINGDKLKLKDIKKVSNKFDVFWRLNNHTNVDWMDAVTINATNKCVAMPLFFISIFILLILLSILVSDIVKTKSKEIIILKSLGANKKSITSVFLLNILLILLVQCIAGNIIGYGILSAVNLVFGKFVGKYDVYFDTFWIGWETILLTIVGILFVAIITMLYAMRKLNGKNLRKMFQKTKE